MIFKECLESGNCWIELGDLPAHLCIETASTVFADLWDMHPRDKHIIYLDGEEWETPRWQQSYGLSYAYAGTVNKALPLTPLQQYLDWANENLRDYDEQGKEQVFNQILINWYENGEHYIEYHSDDTTQLIPDSPIITISYGAEREFKIRRKDHVYEKEILLQTNTYMIMGGEFQKYYEHAIPKSEQVREKRINITMRMFV